jgi:histidinol-phosphate phosphatase family protein
LNTIFIDRDGVINRDRVDYVNCWYEWVWIDGVIDAVVNLKNAGFRVVIFTNQSCIRREIITQQQLDEIHERMSEAFAEAGALLDGIYVCPHGNRDKCDCRKPMPGLILRAAHELDIDLTQSVVVGDAARDIIAGQKAGAARTVLVRTGKGAVTEKENQVKPDIIYDDLASLAADLLAKK